jgi:hypothetical protein
MKRATFWMKLLLIPSLCLLLAVGGRGQGGEITPSNIQEMMAQRGGGSAEVTARALGLTEILGKPVDDGGSPPGNANAPKLIDVGIGIHPTKEENEPTVAANPTDKKMMVAGSHFAGPPAPTTNRCVVFGSSDRGLNWSEPFLMPQLTAASACSDPVLVYAPDGSRVYYAYMDIKQTVVPGPLVNQITVTEDLDILVSFSDNDGATWTGPTVALDGNSATFVVQLPGGQIVQVIDPGFVYDKPWIGTHVDDNESAWAYVSATRFSDFDPTIPPSAIAFSRSSNQGAAWSAPLILDSGAPAGAGVPSVLVQGSRPTGGLGGEVLVAWYQSGTDGFLVGSFNIRIRRSANHGATFSPIVNAAVESFEAPFFLGPLDFYKRWWPTMMPDVEIDPHGAAHIVYAHDPVQGNLTPEAGDIRYVTSGGPPYSVWTSPETVNDDGSGRAQGFPALETQHGGHLHVIWEDSRLAPDLPISTPAQCFSGPVATRQCNSPNLFFDIFYSRKVSGRGGWFSNFRVSEELSIQDFNFAGDYIDLAANDTLLFGIWTDRRHRTSVFDFEDNVFGSRIIAGGASPQ